MNSYYFVRRVKNLFQFPGWRSFMFQKFILHHCLSQSAAWVASIRGLWGGQIFESGSSIFAIGQIKGSHAIRFTRLSFVEHPSRCDLYGIRCGHSALNNRAYAHLVYAYQCNKFEPDLRAVIRSGVSIDDPVLRKHVPNWDAIAARLIPSGLSEMGLQPHPWPAMHDANRLPGWA